MRPFQKLTQLHDLVFQDRFKPAWPLAGSVLMGLLVAWLILKNPTYSWLGMAISLCVVLAFVTFCCLVLLILQRRRTKLRYQWPADHLLRRDGFGFLVWFLAHNGLVMLMGSGLAFGLMWSFGPETWVVLLISPLAACVAVALWGALFGGRRPALALCWSLSLRPRDLSFWDLNKALFLPRRFGMAVDLDRRAEFPLLCDVARVLDLKDTVGGQRNLSLWDGGFSSFGSEILCRVKVLSTVFGCTLLATLFFLFFLPSPNNRPWLGPLDGFGTPFSRAALSSEQPPDQAEREPDQSNPAGAGDSRSQNSRGAPNASGDSQSASGEADSEAGEPGDGSQNVASANGDTSKSASESGEKRAGEPGSQGDNGGASQSQSQPGDSGEGGSEGDKGPQRPGQSGAPGDEGDGNQGKPGDREGGSQPDPDKTDTGPGEKQTQNRDGGSGPPSQDKKGQGHAEGGEQNPGSDESENGDPSGSDPSGSHDSSKSDETAQGMGSPPDSEAKGSGGKAGESTGDNAPTQGGQSQGEGDPTVSDPQSGKGGKSSSPGKDDHTPLMADPSLGGGDGAVRVAFPPAGDGALVTLELPPMGEQLESAQHARGAPAEGGEIRPGKRETFNDEPFSPTKPKNHENTAKPVQHLPNWVLSLLPDTKKRRQTP